jgi:SAM-dependent methyltransferase
MIGRNWIKEKGKYFASLFLSPERKRERSERAYYKQLFLENVYWNRPIPNGEETLRWQIIEKFIEQIKNSNKSKLNILDLGCGRGWLTNLLSNYGEVIGIEPVKAVVDYGKSLFPSLNLITGTTKTLLERGINVNLI